jgi:hypothetical protein
MLVQRYSVNWKDKYMAPSLSGSWVDYEDYECLERENAELRQAINRLEEESRG